MSNHSVVNLFNNPTLLPPVLDWCYRQWWQKPGSTNAELKSILTRHVKEQGVYTTFVAFVDAEPVGSVHFIDKDFDTGDASPCLAGLYVLPKYRQRGLATMLVSSVVDHAKAEGFTQIYLATETAKPWYEKQGWQTVSVIDASTNYVLMKKDIQRCLNQV